MEEIRRMIDIKYIRENPDKFNQHMKRRNAQYKAEEIIKIDEAYRAQLTLLQELQEEKNKVAKEIPVIKKNGGAIDDLVKQGEEIKKKIEDATVLTNKIKNDLHEILIYIPNLFSDDLIDGIDEKDNKEVKRVGTPRIDKVPSHDQIGADLHLMDFETAAKMSGSRFVMLYGALAELERSLSRFMLDVHTSKFGYKEVYPPLLAKEHAFFGTAQLPKFREDQFSTQNNMYLIPTAEVVLTNIVAGSVIKKLPLKFCAYTPCFRLEAGSAGRDTKGMIRQHQFGKVELVHIVDKDTGYIELEDLLNAACHILDLLKLPYRIVQLCTGDTGFAAKKTYDIEVWMPSSQNYREISSCSYFGDFHARRMNSKYKDENGKTHFVHTLNGSGLAVGRTLVALMENYYQADGTIKIPEVLIPYMREKTEIRVEERFI